MSYPTINKISGAVTFFFKELMPDFNSFLDFCDAYDIIPTSKQQEDLAYLRYVFNLLFNRYCNSNVQYDTPDEFYTDFALRLINHYEKFKKQREVIQNISKLTPEELSIIQTTINNVAQNPNTEVENPTQPLHYISNQVYSQTNGNKYNAYLQAINNIPDMRIEQFLNYFQSLFKTILPIIE